MRMGTLNLRGENLLGNNFLGDNLLGDKREWGR